jgi:hypothetical protein
MAHWDFPIEENQIIWDSMRSTGSMRDIRDDLRERLRSIDARYADEMAEYQEAISELTKKHREYVDALSRERAAVDQLLAIEDGRADLPSAPSSTKMIPLVPLGDFLIAKIASYGPMDKEALKIEFNAAGYTGGGRNFHATLMNITNHGKLTQLEDGRYAIPTRATPLFDVEPSQEGSRYM